jgi:hypothetical protein
MLPEACQAQTETGRACRRTDVDRELRCAMHRAGVRRRCPDCSSWGSHREAERFRCVDCYLRLISSDEDADTIAGELLGSGAWRAS